jgi:transposase
LARAALWTFVVEEGVEPTNNRAERALRFAVLWRKMMHGTYNEKGDRWVERMLSLRETCRLRGIPTFPVLEAIPVG